MYKKIKVVIDRSKWRTGLHSVNHTGTGDTELLNSDGYMCCLGFCCKAAGILDAAISGIGAPSDLCKVDKEAEKKIGSLVRNCANHTLNSKLSKDAMSINDDEYSTSPEKEKKLLELFKDSEFEIEFTGEYFQREQTKT
jgi:hypothetical protein